MKIFTEPKQALHYLKEGQIIAYPTEAVYGLGCDPFDEQAVANLLALKQRPRAKGLIILIATWQQLTPLIASLDDTLLEPVKKTWPGPVTWVFPKSTLIPEWICGQHESIAIRMTAHPIASALCVNGPIVSTSANIGGFEPARDRLELNAQFPVGIDALVLGDLGEEKQPSMIYDVLTGRRLR